MAVAPQSPARWPELGWGWAGTAAALPSRYLILSKASLLLGPKLKDRPVSPTPSNLSASVLHPLTFNMDASLLNSMRSSLSLLWFSSRTSGFHPGHERMSGTKRKG